MPLRITPSKRPLPVAKRSSLRIRSYEVEPLSGPKVYPSRAYPIPVRPTPLSDQKAAAFQTSRPQIPPESAADTSLVLSDPMQPPPEVALDTEESISPSWQIATSRRSARTLRRVQPVISSMSIAMHDDVMINPPPASAATSSASTIDDSPPVSAATFSVSTVQAPTSVVRPSVRLPTSVADSTSVLSTPSSDAIPVSMVNPTTVAESVASARCLVNPITGLSTVLTIQQQQYLAQATNDAFMLTSDVLTQRTLNQTLGSNRPSDVPLFSESAIAKTKVTKSLRKKQKKTVDNLRLASISQSSESSVGSTSAFLPSPVESVVSTNITHTVSDNTVAPSRYNPYAEKTIFLKGKFDRKTALKVAYDLKTFECPYSPVDVVPPDEHADFLTLLQRRLPMDEEKQKECESWTKWSVERFCEELLESVPSEKEICG